MIVGVVKESFPGECRVALIPASIPNLMKAGCQVLVESGAGLEAGYPDSAYQQREAIISPSREEVFTRADVLFHLLGFGANAEQGRADLSRYRSGQTAIGFFRPLGAPETVRELAETGVTAFAIEMLPRITRAQSMDALSSMSTVAGYKAVLLAANAQSRMFPMLMTAAGTISPARVLIIGVGVAGLQAIATARRMGAVVSAFDIRPAVKEQVQSLGAKFVELPLEAGDAEDVGGYAKAQGEDFYRRQQELMTKAVAESDVVITTANVPGRKAPVLVTEAMVAAMSPGSVIVDMAAERGGNCELTRAHETISAHGVTIIGTVNLSGEVPYHASQMYSSNITTFFLHMLKDGALSMNLEDEIIRETLITRGGEVVHPRVREALGLAPQEPDEGTEPLTDGTAGYCTDDLRAGPLRGLRGHHEGTSHAAHPVDVWVERDLGHHAGGGDPLVGDAVLHADDRFGCHRGGAGDDQRGGRVSGHPPHPGHVPTEDLTRDHLADQSCLSRRLGAVHPWSEGAQSPSHGGAREPDGRPGDADRRGGHAVEPGHPGLHRDYHRLVGRIRHRRSAGRAYPDDGHAADGCPPQWLRWHRLRLRGGGGAHRGDRDV